MLLSLLLTWMMLVVTVDTAWAVAWAEAVGDRLVTAAVAELTACRQGRAGRPGVLAPREARHAHTAAVWVHTDTPGTHVGCLPGLSPAHPSLSLFQRTQATVLMPSGLLCRRVGIVGLVWVQAPNRTRTAPTVLTVFCTPGTARRELVRQLCSAVDWALAWDQALEVAVAEDCSRCLPVEAEALLEAEAEATSC